LLDTPLDECPASIITGSARRFVRDHLFHAWR